MAAGYAALNFYAAPAFALDSGVPFDTKNPLARTRNLYSSLVSVRSNRYSTFSVISLMNTRVTPNGTCKIPGLPKLSCHTLWGIHRFARVSTKIRSAQPINSVPAITV